MTRTLTVSLLAACGFTTVSNAQLTSVDWVNGGDGLLTYDAASGLYWLDWTQGLDLSRDAMAAELLTGGRFEDFRYATVAELHAFASSGGAPDPGGRTAGNVGPVNSILSLLGANNFYGFLGAGNSSSAHVGNPGNFASFTIESFDNPLTAKAGAIGSASTDQVFGLGHALVSTVPTPSAAGLFTLGAMTALRRRRR